MYLETEPQAVQRQKGEESTGFPTYVCHHLCPRLKESESMFVCP